MYVFTIARFDELYDIMEGTALMVLQIIKDAGYTFEFEQYAQAYLDRIGGATYKTLSMWLGSNAASILTALNVPL